jgi:hypothetical protein
MKNLILLIIGCLCASVSESQLLSKDIRIALAIRASQDFSPKVTYTFDKKKFQQNQDSSILYELTQKNPSVHEMLSRWRALVDPNDSSFGPNKGWHKGLLVTYDETYRPTEGNQYSCGFGSYADAKELEADQSGETDENSHRIIITKHCGVKAYLVYHKKIKPSEIFLMRSSRGWAFPLLTRYARPVLAMKLLPDSLRKKISDPAELQMIEKLVNEPDLEKYAVSETLPQKATDVPATSSKMYDITVSKTDTVIFSDYEEEDGDKVSIYFDGEIVAESASIEHHPYKVPIQSKARTIDLVVEDEGTKPPCTLRVYVNNKTYYFPKKKGEQISILRN